MNISRLIQRSIPFAAVALIAAAPAAAFGQRGQEVFEWNGRVDREVQITMRGNRLTTRDIGRQAIGRANSRVLMTLPRRDGQLYVQLLNGRGSAEVIQQPTAQNGYTATVRIEDQSGGMDNYRIAAYWENMSNGEVSRGRRDRNDGYNNRRGDANVYGGTYANQSVLHWSGNVDGELEIRIQNGRVQYRNLSGSQPTAIRATVGDAAQNALNGVSISQNQGRGSVVVVQQPTSYNGYTTVLRVRDPQSGSSYYDFDVLSR